MRIGIIGGGAAGFFAAANLRELLPHAKITLLEKGNQCLAKVKISGGGRCNVTHACFDPKELTSYYPRGGKELLGPFHKFACGDTIAWFADRGVELKIEEDGRMFPITDRSQTIIDCLMHSAEGTDLHMQEGIQKLERSGEEWHVRTQQHQYAFDHVIITTGSSPQVWDLLEQLNIKIIDPVPSLFTLQSKDPLLLDLPGISMSQVTLKLENSSIETEGAFLITHKGISGPAVLRLSAWGALEFHQRNYHTRVLLNMMNRSTHDALDRITEKRSSDGGRKLKNDALFEMPSRLWQRILDLTGCAEKNWADLSKQNVEELAIMLTAHSLQITGKNTFKEEFVTAGGIDLSEVDMRTMQCKQHPHLFFAGEVLNIDAVTGGFNFQAAWTTAWLACQAIAGQ